MWTGRPHPGASASCRWPHSRDARAHLPDGQAALQPALLCCRRDRQDGRSQGRRSRGWPGAAAPGRAGVRATAAGELCTPRAQAVVRRIPRSREVGQSYVTSVWTTLVALCAAFAIVFSQQPELVRPRPHHAPRSFVPLRCVGVGVSRPRPPQVLVNGPGTCVPVCLAALTYRCVRSRQSLNVRSAERTAVDRPAATPAGCSCGAAAGWCTWRASPAWTRCRCPAGSCMTRGLQTGCLCNGRSYWAGIRAPSAWAACTRAPAASAPSELIRPEILVNFVFALAACLGPVQIVCKDSVHLRARDLTLR